MEEPIPQTETVESLEKPPRRAWIVWLALGGLAIFICAAGFVGTLIFAGPQFTYKFLPDWVKPAEQRPREITQNNTMGDPNAPIHIIEYGDFQCPFCLRFWKETEPQLIKEYVNTGQVYFEYRAYAFIGPESILAAEAAYCAGDQGKFWEYHDTLFTNWTGENVGDFTKEKLIQYAETLNLDMEAFEQCLSEGKHKETVEQDGVKAKTDGVHATPTFIINDVKIEGAQPFDVFKHIIREMLDGNLNTQSG